MRVPLVLSMAASMALAILTPALALAQGPQPVDQPAGFAEVRARFEGKTYAQIQAMGYVAAPPECVSHPQLGGMGIHAVNGQLMGEQFPTAQPDPQNPPVVLMSADLETVIGIEWEIADVGQGEFELWGQTVTLQPGHPGAPEPHYMLHAYFRSNGQVLFAPFDPEVTCPPDTATVADLTVAASVATPAMLLAVVLTVAGSAVAAIGLQRRRRAA